MGRNHHSTAAEQCLQVRQNQSFWASHPASRVWWGYQWDDLHFLEWIFWGYRLSKLAWKVDFLSKSQFASDDLHLDFWSERLKVDFAVLQVLGCELWTFYFVSWRHLVGWTGQEKCSDKGGALSSFTRVVHLVVGWQLNQHAKGNFSAAAQTSRLCYGCVPKWASMRIHCASLILQLELSICYPFIIEGIWVSGLTGGRLIDHSGERWPTTNVRRDVVVQGSVAFVACRKVWFRL